MALMVHVITGPIGHLSDILELLPLDPGGPELHRIASNRRKDEKFSSIKIKKVSPIIRVSKVKLLISYRQSMSAN